MAITKTSVYNDIDEYKEIVYSIEQADTGINGSGGTFLSGELKFVKNKRVVTCQLTVEYSAQTTGSTKANVKLPMLSQAIAGDQDILDMLPAEAREDTVEVVNISNAVGFVSDNKAGGLGASKLLYGSIATANSGNDVEFVCEFASTNIVFLKASITYLAR